MLQLVRALFITALFVYTGLKLPSTGVWRSHRGGYLLFLSLALMLSLIALRLSFYPPSDISVLKEPFVLALSRVLELSLAIYFMLSIADTLQNRPRLFRIVLDTYTGIGAVSALASICAFAIFQFTGRYTFLIDD